MWRSPNQRVPNDLQWLSRRCRCKADAMHMLITEFCICTADWVTQKRLLKEWAYVANLTQKRSDSAKRRWNKDSSSCIASDLHTTLHTTLHEPSNAPTPTPIEEEERVSSLRSSTARARDPLADKMAWDRFWYAYPHKVGIQAARKAFAAAITKTTADELIAGLERYKLDKPPDRNWCNPSTFLNQERWLDQPAPSPNGSMNGHDQPKPRSRQDDIIAAFANAVGADQRPGDSGTDITPPRPLLDAGHGPEPTKRTRP